MNKNLISRYIWIVDALLTHGKLTREQLDSLWRKSSLSGGNALPERTFFNYRRSIEDIFKIQIECNTHGEYYIKKDDRRQPNNISDWLLDSFAINNILADSPDITDRIEVEEVPSAREFLPSVVNALRTGTAIRFDYGGFNRSITEPAILFHPYFLKRYKQRWYMIGNKVKDNELRTYALDRVKALELTGTQFKLPEGLTLRSLFGNILGVTSSKADERTVRLRATRTQAKYFRALPFHHTQKEELTADDYSVFSYRLKLNYELVHELMSLGDGIKVLEPRELQVMLTNEMKKALNQYEG